MVSPPTKDHITNHEAPPTDKDASRLIPIPEPSAMEIASYVEQITMELYHLARHKKLDLLAYFLTMANMEAQEQARSQQELD